MILGFWTFTSSSASANFPPVLTGGCGCAAEGGWNINFKAASLIPGKAGEDDKVDVSYQTDTGNGAGGEWKSLPWKPTWKFSEMSGNAFEDFVKVPEEESAKHINLKVKPHDKPEFLTGWLPLPGKCKGKPETPPESKPVVTVPEQPMPTSVPPHTKPPKPEKTTTTAPTTTVAPTTVTEAPATTAVAVSPTSMEVTTTTVAPTGGGNLPVTGSRSAGLAAFAGALLLGGFFLVRASRATS